MANEFVIKNGFISKGDSIVNGTISGETLNLTTTPSNDNSQTQVLVRNNTSGLIEYRDASSLSGTSGTNTFVTGTTFGSNQSITRRNDGADVLILTGGTNVTLSNPSSNQIKFDVNIPAGMNTYVTGFTYNDNNTFTIFDNDGGSFPATFNQVSGLTTTNFIDYANTSDPSAVSGRTYYDISENALSYFPQTPSMDVTINIGQESVTRIYNDTGVQINNGQACHINGSFSGTPTVNLAIASGITVITETRFKVSGVATHDIPNGTYGFITTEGLVRDLTITGTTNGSPIWLSDTDPGEFIYDLPTNNASRVSQIGYVVSTGVTTGKILVEVSLEASISLISAKESDVITQNNSSTGTRVGGLMTVNGGDNTKVDISSGSGIIVDNYTNAEIPVLTQVAWDTITGVTLTSLTGDVATFLFLDTSGLPVQFALSAPPQESDKRDYIYLGLVGHPGPSIANIFNTPIQIVSPINQHEDLTSSIGPFSTSGNRIDNITGTLELQKSAGNSYVYGGNFHSNPKVPSNIATGTLSGSTLIYAKGTAVLGPTSADIDADNYDANGLGTISPIPGANYVAARIWHSPLNNLLTFQYGQYSYSSQAITRDSFPTENYITPPGLDVAAYVIAVLIYKKGDGNLDNALIIPQGKFAGTGGGGTSPDTLQSVYDNSNTNPEILTDATNGSVDIRVGSGSDSDNLIRFQQNDGTVNAFVEGTGDAKFTNLTGTSVTSNSAINVFNGHVNLRDNSYFLQGRTVADVNVSLIGVDNQDRVFVGNAGYDTYINSDTIVDGVLSAQTAFLATTPTLNNSATDILVRNSSTGEVEYRPVSGITPDTNTFVSGGTYNDTTNNINFSGNSAETTFDVDLSSLVSSVSANTFVISGTYVDSTDTLALLRNDGNFVNVTGITDTFTTGSTYDNGTALATFNKNDGTNYTLDLSTIDVNDTFVTGTTFGSNQATVTRNDGTDVLFLTGGTNVTLSNPSTNQIKFDVTIPSGSNTFVTGFTYDDINTFTINDNTGSAFTTSINVLSATTISATTFYGDGSNLTGVLAGNPNVRNISTTQSILTTDGTLNCTGGTITLTLPTAVGVTGKEYVIKNSGVSSEITVDTTSSQTIDGSTSILITRQYLSRRVQSNGVGWIVI